MKVGDTVSALIDLDTGVFHVPAGSWGDIVVANDIQDTDRVAVKFRAYRVNVVTEKTNLKLEYEDQAAMMAEYAAQGGFEPDEHAAPLPNTVEGFIVPDYYGGRNNPYEVFKVIRAWELGFFLGNALKYIKRWNLKGDPIENLKKAREYITNEIEDLEAKRNK